MFKFAHSDLLEFADIPDLDPDLDRLFTLPLSDFNSDCYLDLFCGVTCLRALLGVVLRPSDSFSLTLINLL